jgi:hypothetical protein
MYSQGDAYGRHTGRKIICMILIFTLVNMKFDSLIVVSEKMMPLFSCKKTAGVENLALHFPFAGPLRAHIWVSLSPHKLPNFQTLTSLFRLVVRVLGYRSGGLGSIPSTTRKKK